MDSRPAKTYMTTNHKRSSILLAAVLLAAVVPAAGAAEGESEPKTISGMSVVGNNEAPKSLYIVPWKSSELGVETDLSSSLLNDKMAPVDKEVFMRELNFYELTRAE